MEKKRLNKAFSLIEVVISVSLIALILSTLGMSFLATQRLKLNAQIVSEVQKCGEMILDYLSTLPPTDFYVDNTINPQNTDENNIISLADLQNPNSSNASTIINTINNLIDNFARTSRFDFLNNANANVRSRKGGIVRISSNDITFDLDNNNNLLQLRLRLVYVYPSRRINRTRNVTITRLIVI